MNKITVETIVNAPLDKVWECWTEPEHINQWAFADESWEALDAENDVTAGGRFKTTMAAKDKSASFDFTGVYTRVEPKTLMEYDMDKAPNDSAARHVSISFLETPEGNKIVETFDPENENPEEMQRSGWQSILDNFKKHVENH